MKKLKILFNLWCTIINMLVDLEVEMRFGGDEIGGDIRFSILKAPKVNFF